MDIVSAIKIAKSKKSTVVELAGLLGSSKEVDLLLAKHVNCTTDLLDEICKRHPFSKEITIAALAHPDVSVDQVLKNGWLYPLALYQNPALPKLMREHKNLLGEFEGEVYEKSLKTELPGFVVDWLLSQGKAEYQLIYVSSPKRQPEELAKFRDSKHPSVVAALLDRDVGTYTAWASDLGFDLVAPNQLSTPDMPVDTATVRAQPVLPGVLLAVMKQIEGSYFKGGRVTFSADNTFYGGLLLLLQDALKGKAKFTKLVDKVVEYDLAELKRFASPGKKPPPDISKPSYYVKSGLEKSFKRLTAALASNCQQQAEAYSLELSQDLASLVTSNPVPEKVSRPVTGTKVATATILNQIDETTLLAWATELGFALPPANEDDPVDAKWEFENWSECEGDKVSELAKQLVPKSGHAESLQGELVRAISRLESEYHRNGMMNWGDGSNFYENFAKLIHTTLKAEKSFSKLVLSVLDADIAAVKKSGVEGKEIASGKKTREEVFSGSFFVERDVERSHLRLRILIAKWCERNPSPLPYESTTRN